MNTYLTNKITVLEKKSPQGFSIEDLRISIGQNFNLVVLIPLAIIKLKQDLFAEGDYYPGDLLQSVLSADDKYWQTHGNEWREVCALCEMQEAAIQNTEVAGQIMRSIERFLRIFPRS